jgi:hypothetical protein
MKQKVGSPAKTHAWPNLLLDTERDPVGIHGFPVGSLFLSLSLPPFGLKFLGLICEGFFDTRDMYLVTGSSVDFRWNPKEINDLSNPRRTEEVRFSDRFLVEPELIFSGYFL